MGDQLRLLGPGEIAAFVALIAPDASAWADHYALTAAEQGQRFGYGSKGRQDRGAPRLW
jgi:hypothetical protein